LKAAILISGSGTNLQSFIDQVGDGRLELEIAVVFSNRRDAYGLERALNADIPTVCIDHGEFAEREQFDRSVAAALDEIKPDLIILAGFMRILSPWFVSHYEGKILNIHPALLPLYPGLNTHARALEAGDSHHGSTVHFVTDELDAGPRILAGCLAIQPQETAGELKSRVQALEHRIYPQAAQLCATGRVTYDNGAALLDGQLMTDPILVDF
jgi:phosphoribosylglycinamide formyltransferase-1